MKALLIAMSVAAALPALPAAARPLAETCDLAGTPRMGELSAKLSLRAVEIVELASGADFASNARLAQLLGPTASFALGSGDVGQPFGRGAAAAHRMAAEMGADGYRFEQWSTIPTPIADACARYQVAIEFADSRRGYYYPVTFTFEAGRLVSAVGWTKWYETGRLRPKS